MIKSIHIENFMSIKNADIAFDGSNIIDLCGYNDSGKSAVIRLIDIMFYNAYSTEQVHFIRTGEDFFRCVMTFTDGVEYERIKKSTGASIFILRKDGQEIYNNQTGRQIINTTGIPRVISNYLGVIRDDYTKEELNVRRCTDRLFLINTTGGDNYKILNTILQSEALAETSTRLNTDKNRLQQEVVAKYNQLSALQTQREETPVVPTVALDTLIAEAARLEISSKRMEAIEQARTYKRERDSIVIAPHVSTINFDRYQKLTDIKGYKQASEKSIFKAVSSVSVDKLQALFQLCEYKATAHQPIQRKVSTVSIDLYQALSNLVALKAKVQAVEIPRAVETVIDTGRIQAVKGLYAAYKEAKQRGEDWQEKQTAYEGVQSKLTEFARQYDLTICKNCGAVTAGGHKHE